MALTKLNFYIGVLLVVSLLLGGLILTGESLLNKDRITLSPDSENYINLINQQGNDSNLDNIYDSESGEIKQKSLLGETEEEGGVPVVSDVLAVLNFFRNIATNIVSFLKIIYNVPTIILISLGLPVIEFSFMINTITYILFIALLITIIKNILK